MDQSRPSWQRAKLKIPGTLRFRVFNFVVLVGEAVTDFCRPLQCDTANCNVHLRPRKRFTPGRGLFHEEVGVFCNLSIIPHIHSNSLLRLPCDSVSLFENLWWPEALRLLVSRPHINSRSKPVGCPRPPAPRRHRSPPPNERSVLPVIETFAPQLARPLSSNLISTCEAALTLPAVPSQTVCSDRRPLTSPL